jgi:hypothetical protein
MAIAKILKIFFTAQIHCAVSPYFCFMIDGSGNQNDLLNIILNILVYHKKKLSFVFNQIL